MKIYLDDVRFTPDGWFRTQTVDDTIDCLSKKTVTHLSLDNDLGEGEKEGYLIVDWLEEKVNNDPSFLIPEITVHSANPVRSKYMQRGIKNIEKIRSAQIENFKKTILDSIEYVKEDLGYKIVTGHWIDSENKCACALSCVVIKNEQPITSDQLMMDYLVKLFNVSDKWIDSFVEGFDNLGSSNYAHVPYAWILGNEINQKVNPKSYY